MKNDPHRIITFVNEWGPPLLVFLCAALLIYGWVTR